MPTPTPKACWGRRVEFTALADQPSLVPMLRAIHLTDSRLFFTEAVPDGIFSSLGVKRRRRWRSYLLNLTWSIELAAATPGKLPHRHGDQSADDSRGRRVCNVDVACGWTRTGCSRVARKVGCKIALDVFEQEPLPSDSPLRRIAERNAVHLGGPTRDRRRDAGALAVKNLRAFLAR